MLNLHVYNSKGTEIKTVWAEERFQNMTITHDVVDFSTMTFSVPTSIMSMEIDAGCTVYVEEDGFVHFAGIITSFNYNETVISYTCYDLRWILTKLMLDKELIITKDMRIETILKDIIALANKKLGYYQVLFDEENSAVDGLTNLDLVFRIGDKLSEVFYKVIESTYARWDLRTDYKDGVFVNRLVVRSIRNVTPQGVGISRTFRTSEDGDVITLWYEQGNPRNNVQSFRYVSDMTNVITRPKIAYVDNGVTKYAEYKKGSDELNEAVETYYGIISEQMMSDYSVNSKETAEQIANLNINYPIIGYTFTLSPDIKYNFNPSDRVNITIKTPAIIGIEGVGARIEKVTLQREDGFFLKTLETTNINPKTRVKKADIVDFISETQKNLDHLNKKFLS